MTWEEVDLEAKLWTVPAARMKMSREHIVPLTPTTRSLFRRLRELAGGSRLVVPGEKLVCPLRSGPP